MNEVLGFNPGADLGIANEVQNAFVIYTTKAIENIEPSVMWLLGSFLTIRFVWGMIKAMSTGENPVKALFDLLIFIGCIKWFLEGWVTLNDTFMFGFVEQGLKVSNAGITLKEFMNPSAVLANGMALGGNIAGIVQVQELTMVGAAKVAVYNYLGLDHGLMPTLFHQIAAVFVILCSFFIAAYLTIAILEYKFSLIYTMFMVAAGVLTHTRFSLKAAIRYNIATGLRLFMLATMTAVSEEMWAGMIKDSGQGHLMTYNETLTFCFAAATLALLSWLLPSKFANFAQGGPMLDGVVFLKTAYKAAETAASAVNPKAAAAQVAKKAVDVAMKAVNPGDSTPGKRDQTGLIGTTKEATIAAAKSSKGPKFKQAARA